MSNKESNIEKTNFDAFIQAVGSEIEQAQVRLIVAANAQMLFHYWKIGNYILYHQQLHGWGSKIIKQLAKAIRLHYPEKKGYSERNLTYMCQFAKAYPLRALQSFIETDASLSVPTIQSVTNEVLKLNDKQFTQELTAQMQSIDCQSLAITQEVPAQFEDVGKTVSAIYRMGIREIEEVFLTSPIAKINWTSQMTILDSSLPLGLSYWYMKQSVEMGWGSGALLGGLVLACKALKSKQTLVMHTAYVILGLYLISASYLPSSAFIGFVCLTFTGGIAYSIYHALFIAIIQQNLASDMLGRTFSLIFSLSTFPSMLGIVASGYWVEAWGITSVFMISGWVIFLIGVGANFISSIKQLDNYA